MSTPSPRRLRRPKSEAVPSPSFHVVLVPESGPSTCHSFTTPEELAEFLSDYQGQPAETHYFQGTRFFTTKGPFRKLLIPGREPVEIPMPAPDDYDQPSEDGYLGDRSLEIRATEIVVPPPMQSVDMPTNPTSPALPPSSDFDASQLLSGS